jgi:type VI protein secretion system component VasF
LSFAVNLAPEESNTAPLPLEQLERLGLPLQHQVTSSPQEIQRRKQHLQAAQLENRQKLWRWLIVVALVVLVVETWLAGRLTHGTAVAAPEG